MTIELLKGSEVNAAVQTRIRELFQQLNADIRQLDVESVLSPENHIVFAICKEDNLIVGIAAMATYKVISGHKGMIEDVIVDENQRGKGIGRKLMQKLLAEGKKQNLDEILLFSGHHRLPAINLYKSLGFQLKESGLYRLKMHWSPP